MNHLTTTQIKPKDYSGKDKVLITGDTGTGKSVNAQSIILQDWAKKASSLTIIDGLISSGGLADLKEVLLDINPHLTINHLSGGGYRGSEAVFRDLSELTQVVRAKEKTFLDKILGRNYNMIYIDHFALPELYGFGDLFNKVVNLPARLITVVQSVHDLGQARDHVQELFDVHIEMRPLTR